MHVSLFVEVKRSAEPFVPKSTGLKVLRAAVQQCRGCDLYKRATQAVFGAGPKGAHVMFVGEQPGDQEDLQGAPFVGRPARSSTKRWPMPVFRATTSTSPTR